MVLPQSMVLVSPWIDLSLSHTPPHIQHYLASHSDYLSPQILEAWRDNITPNGKNPRDPSLSPFFDLSPIEMPQNGILIVYGTNEVMSPVINDWVKCIRKQPDGQAKVKVILGVDMPHDFALYLHDLPTSAYSKANRALLEISKFICQPSKV